MDGELKTSKIKIKKTRKHNEHYNIFRHEFKHFRTSPKPSNLCFQPLRNLA